MSRTSYQREDKQRKQAAGDARVNSKRCNSQQILKRIEARDAKDKAIHDNKLTNLSVTNMVYEHVIS